MWQVLPGEGALGRDILMHAVEITLQVRARREAERLRAEAELARADAERASRVKSEFLSVMSHELRTPLNAIGGYAELLALGVHGPLSPEQNELLGRIQRSQQHLLALITNLLNFTRLEEGAVEYRMSAVPLAPLVADVGALVAPLAAQRGLAYSAAPNADPGSDNVVAQADRAKLAQVLLNLLSNAVKFTEAGGRIEVTWGRVREPVDGENDGENGMKRVFIQVRDTGRGIAPDKLVGVFEPFVQVDGGRTRRHEGVGLGLAIARDLARGMGGDLTVESGPEGSAFRVEIGAAGPGSAE